MYRYLNNHINSCVVLHSPREFLISIAFGAVTVAINCTVSLIVKHLVHAITIWIRNLQLNNCFLLAACIQVKCNILRAQQSLVHTVYLWCLVWSHLPFLLELVLVGDFVFFFPLLLLNATLATACCQIWVPYIPPEVAFGTWLGEQRPQSHHSCECRVDREGSNTSSRFETQVHPAWFRVENRLRTSSRLNLHTHAGKIWLTSHILNVRHLHSWTQTCVTVCDGMWLYDALYQIA